MEPIEGSLETLREIEMLGISVFICTSPLSQYENCVVEKYRWVEKYLGKEWIGRIILTKDKTLIRGDYLIDDKPEITGSNNPVWEHVLYERPYNQKVTGKRRLTWDNWKDIL